MNEIQENFSERDFLDELYEHAHMVEPEKRRQEIEYIFKFGNYHDAHMFKHMIIGHPSKTLDSEDEFQLKIGGKLHSPRRKAYSKFVDTFQRLGLLRTTFVSSGAEQMSVWFTPNDFMDFYNRRLGIQEKSDPAERHSLKPKIYLDRRRGVYMLLNDQKVFYPRLLPSTKIFKTIIFMQEKKVPMNLAIICKYVKQEGKVLKKAIKRFNENSQRKFKLGKNEVVIGNDSGIYELNLKHYDFKVVERGGL